MQLVNALNARFYNEDIIFNICFNRIEDFIQSKKYSVKDYFNLCKDLQYNVPLECEYNSVGILSSAVVECPAGGYFAMGHNLKNGYDCNYTDYGYTSSNNNEKQKQEADKLDSFNTYFRVIELYNTPYNYGQRLLSYVCFFSDISEIRRYYREVISLSYPIFSVLSLYYRHFDSYTLHYMKYFANNKKLVHYGTLDIVNKDIEYLTPEEESKRILEGYTPPCDFIPSKILSDCLNEFAPMMKECLRMGLYGGWRTVNEPKKKIILNLTTKEMTNDGRTYYIYYKGKSSNCNKLSH